MIVVFCFVFLGGLVSSRVGYSHIIISGCFPPRSFTLIYAVLGELGECTWKVEDTCPGSKCWQNEGANLYNLDERRG